MAELRTEEEQLEAIKRWWKNNGTSLIAGVVIAASGVFGWQAWQGYQADQAEAASMRYQQLLTIAGQGDSQEAHAEAQRLINEINEEHDGTLYADMATLVQAGLAANDGDHDTAMSSLETLIASSDRSYLQGLARLRLARLQLAEGSAEAALDTLESGVPDALGAQRADLHGDIFISLGREEDAREAYQTALQLSQENAQPVYGVQLKLDDLGVKDSTL